MATGKRLGLWKQLRFCHPQSRAYETICLHSKLPPAHHHLQRPRRGWVEVGGVPQQKQSKSAARGSRGGDEMKAGGDLGCNLCPAAAGTRKQQRKSAGSCLREEGEPPLGGQKKGFGLLQKLSKGPESNFCLGANLV